MKKKKNIVIVVVFLLLITYGLTYIPQKIVRISPADVAKITVFNGNTGNHIEITDKTDIDYVINNLNDVTFKKGKLAFGYAGYSFNTTIYNSEEKIIEELIINSESVIRYKNFFYEATTNQIDYAYLENLFE